MPNVVVTSTANSIKVVFNDYAAAAMMDKGAWSNSEISNIILHSNHVEVITKDGERWILSHTTNSINALIIDSIDGIAPSSLSDLYDKMAALIA